MLNEESHDFFKLSPHEFYVKRLFNAQNLEASLEQTDDKCGLRSQAFTRYMVAALKQSKLSLIMAKS
jgi:hypothetical protein